MSDDIVKRLRNGPTADSCDAFDLVHEAAAEIERLRAENATARQAAERSTLHHIELRDAQRRRAERAEAQVAALREALTPSGDTKAEYSGEFKISFPETQYDEEEGIYVDVHREIMVPWPTIKEIMKSISARAALEEK